MTLILFLLEIVTVAFAAVVYIKFLGLEKGKQFNSAKLNELAAELEDTKKRLLQAELGLAELAQETEVVQDLKEYNEGISNILNYSRETAKGSK